MKFFTATFLLLSLMSFANCQKSEIKVEKKSLNNTVNNLQTKSLTKLYQAIRAKDIEDVEFKDNEIKVGKLRIKLTTTVEHDLFNQGKWVFAAKYDTKIIDESETIFTVGSIGIGSDKSDAEETSIEEWIGLFGTALIEMLTKSEKLAVDGFKVYSGLMGIRGEKPSKSWLDASPQMDKKILNALLPIIRKSNKKLSSLNLMISVSPNGEIGGECMFNNEVSEEVLKELKKLNWQNSQTGYLFKQFYLIN